LSTGELWIWTNNFFWRRHDQQEIDFIEESDGMLTAYEIKWNKNRKPYLSKTFNKAYSNNEFPVVIPNNIEL